VSQKRDRKAGPPVSSPARTHYLDDLAYLRAGWLGPTIRCPKRTGSPDEWPTNSWAGNQSFSISSCPAAHLGFHARGDRTVLIPVGDRQTNAGRAQRITRIVLSCLLLLRLAQVRTRLSKRTGYNWQLGQGYRFR